MSNKNPFKASDPMLDRVSAIQPRIRSALDASKVTSVTTVMRQECVDATMKLLNSIQDISDPITYPSISRAMLAVAHSTPIKCLCIGISPYENGILPPVATSLSYSPMACSGSPPSVQVLSQAMSVCASKIMYVRSKNPRLNITPEMLTPDAYVAKFAMMLRCSYACLALGVGFVNCCPTVVKDDAKRARCSSLFSEWLGTVIRVHGKYDTRISVVSMGEDADEAVKNVFKSFPGSAKSVRYTKTVNPAFVSRLNVKKVKVRSPIDESITKLELAVAKVVGVDGYASAGAHFEWYSYDPSVVSTLMESDAIVDLTRQLVDHSAHQLLTTFLEMAQSMYGTGNGPNIESLLGAMGIADNDEGVSIAGSSTNRPGMSSPPPAPARGMSVNPFVNLGGGMPKGGNQEQHTAQTQSSNPFVSPQGGQEKYTGPPMVGRRSQIGQMIDPHGKAVSQQVIIIESILKSVQDTSTSYKELHRDMVEIIKRQVNIVKTMNSRSVLTEDEATTMQEYLSEFEQFSERVMKNMEEACSLFAGLPHVIEGDRGIYEHEAQPVGPLMRRYDGSTMNENVYAPMLESTGNRIQPAATTNTNEERYLEQESQRDRDWDERRKKIEDVMDKVVEIACQAVEEEGGDVEECYKALTEHKVSTEAENMQLGWIMSDFVLRVTEVLGDRYELEHMVVSIMALLESYDDDDVTDLGNSLTAWSHDADSFEETCDSIFS